MKTLLLLSGLLVSNCIAQRSDTIYQQLVSNGSVTGVTANVNNIGQTGHQAFVLFSNASGQTCSNSAFTGQLEYSYNTTSFTSFGSPIVATAASYVSLGFVANGAYPFVRFNVAGFDTTHCRISVWYTGTIVALSPYVQGLLQNANGSGRDVNPVIIGGLSGFGGRAVVQTLPVCVSTAFGTATAGNTVTVLDASGNPINHGYLCSVVMVSTGAGTGKLVSGTDANCATSPTDLTPAFTLATGVPITLGNGAGSILAWDAKNFICVVATGGNVSVLLNWANI